jgi:hypothetical protein
VLWEPRENVLPAVHGVITVPPGQAEPGGQAVHTLLVLEVQGVVSYVPAAHAALHVAIWVPPVQ